MKMHRVDALTDTAPHCQRGGAVSDIFQRAPPLSQGGVRPQGHMG